jgi:hypothetical protein
LGQDRPQVPFAEDQHPVGDLGPGGEHEPFGEGIRARAPWRDLHGPDPGAGQDSVERGGELPGAVAAWARRNCRQLMSVCRFGAGGIRRNRSTRRMVDALTRWPSLSSSPWIR